MSVEVAADVITAADDTERAVIAAAIAWRNADMGDSSYRDRCTATFDLRQAVRVMLGEPGGVAPALRTEADCRVLDAATAWDESTRRTLTPGSPAHALREAVRARNGGES